jgi:hypothetical protein
VGSTRAIDSLLVWGQGIYIPSEDRFVPDNGRNIIRQSASGAYELLVRYDDATGEYVYSVNGKTLVLRHGIGAVNYASWSPDD